MVKKIQKTNASKKAASEQTPLPLSGAIKDSAQQIWLAGLGAFSKAQEEGGKAFEILVKEGLAIQRKSQAAAEERITEATHRVSDMANDISSRAVGQWDKLENIFEDRVAKSLNKLGVPSARDIALLMERIDALSAAVSQLSQAPTPKASRKAVAIAAEPAPVAAEPAPAVVDAPVASPAAARKKAAKKTAKPAAETVAEPVAEAPEASTSPATQAPRKATRKTPSKTAARQAAAE
jgi:poly(hydroxyalkanoate) granule-associated protein